jgi:ATP-dependent metalloprotease
VDLAYIARSTNGLTGADLHNILNLAALKAASEDLPAVSTSAINYALDRISMGPERKSAIVSAETIRRTAYHEAAHALVALKTEG